MPENSTKLFSVALLGLVGLSVAAMFAIGLLYFFNGGETFSANIGVLLLLANLCVISLMAFFAYLFLTRTTFAASSHIDSRQADNAIDYDPLTGLPKLPALVTKLEKCITTPAPGHSCILLSLSIDSPDLMTMSPDNDVGLRKAMAKRLGKLVRKGDLVAHVEHCDFVVFVSCEKSRQTASDTASVVAQKILTELSGKFVVNGESLYVRTSIGIAMHPWDGGDAETLLETAKLARNKAVRLGANNFQFYGQLPVNTLSAEKQIENGLREALPKNEMRLFYQPIYEAENCALWGYEVLVRWSQDQAKMIPPDHFIPIADEMGLMVPIGKWILNAACQQQKEWREQGYDLRRVSVNISAKQFLDPNFIAYVEEALTEHGLAASYLILEITESLLVGDTDKIIRQLEQLKAIGVAIALDDFGTGYSSLSHLKKFPVDILKIDKAFIREISNAPKDSRITSAIIDMGHSLGLTVVAEGVENAEQLSYLRAKGCDVVQGYYLSHPLPAKEATKLLKPSDKLANTLEEKPGQAS